MQQSIYTEAINRQHNDLCVMQGVDEWTGRRNGKLHVRADDTQTDELADKLAYFGTIPGGCLQKVLAHKFGQASLPTTADGGGVNQAFYVMLVPLDFEHYKLELTAVEPGSQEKMAGIDPN